MHQKQAALGSVLLDVLGLSLLSSANIDTDQLSTLAGEVARKGSMREVAPPTMRLSRWR